MTDVAENRFRKPQLRRRPGAHGLSRLPLVAFAVAACFAAGLVVFLLWPRWPAGSVALDAPTLPVTVGGVAFNLPPAAIRVPVQRRPGAHDRVDLAFLWPSLEPPDPHAKATPAIAEGEPAPALAMDRLFVTLSAASDRLAPAERVQAIYTRYVSQQATADSRGLLTLPFRDGSPYQGEDLIYESPANPVHDGFLVRCTRNGPGPTPGICLYERRIERADIVVRFPRDWLDDWRAVAQQTGGLIARLRPRS
jgi:hypothetical protein